MSRASLNSSSSITKSNKGGNMKTSLRKGIPRASKFSKMREPEEEEEESIWKGFFGKNILGMFDISKYLHGSQLSDLEELKKLPGHNIWKLPARTSIGNGKIIDVEALRNRLLAEHYGGSQNIPEEILLELFPDEQVRKEFIEKYRTVVSPTQNSDQKEENTRDDISFFNTEFMGGKGGVETNDEMLQLRPYKRKVMVKNANGEFEEVIVEELTLMKKVMKKVMVLNADGEWVETETEEWVPVEGDLAEVSPIHTQNELPATERKYSAFGFDFEEADSPGLNIRRSYSQKRKTNGPLEYRRDSKGNIVAVYEAADGTVEFRRVNSSLLKTREVCKPLSEKEIEQQVQIIMQNMTFKNETERKEFEAKLREELRNNGSLLTDENGNPLSPSMLKRELSRGNFIFILTLTKYFN